MTTVADLGERALIERIRQRVPPAPSWVAIGIGDDAAVLEGERNGLTVVTTDSLVEAVHFDRAFTPPRAIGYRALAANLSDLAAMGARPRGALLSLALPDALPLEDFDALVDGLLAVASRYRVPLVGGNISRSPGPLVVDITALGTVQRRRILRRAGARPGDLLYVSGSIGAAAAGLGWCRKNGLAAAAGVDHKSGTGIPEPVGVAGTSEREQPAVPGILEAARFLYPDPRLRLGWLLAGARAATACVDLSDGLADAVHQMASAGGVGAIVDAEAVPVTPGTRRWFEGCGTDPVDAALTGGEDYELLFTIPMRRQRVLQAVARGLGDLRLTRVGVITRGPDVVVRRGGREAAMPHGFTHFR